jgi:tetratricopeptide (TPR) repeat protein
MKRLMFLTALIGSIVLVSILLIRGGPSVVRVQAQEPPPASQPGMAFDSLLQQGKQLKEAGNYSAALPLLQQALEKDPKSDPAMILAGACLQKIGQPSQALTYFDKVAAGKGFRATALYCAAECYRDLGQNAQALAALKAAREDSPIDKWGIKALGLMAEIEGRSAAAAMAREEEAAALYRAARDRGKETHYKSPEPLAMFDRVITQYPGTGGAYCALSQKAELLWHLGKREDMCKTYEQLREILRGYTGSEKVRLAYRTMDCRIGQTRAEELLNEINRDLAGGREVSQARWDHLGVLCDRWRHNADDANQALADLFIVCISSCQGKDAEMVTALDGFFRQYYEPDKNRMMDPDYKDVFAGAHLLAARALKKLNRNDEALAHFRAIVDMSITTPPLPQDKVYGPAARWEVCRLLKAMGASRSELQQAVDAFVAEYPGHRLAESARGLLRGQ